jgi:DNA-binding protein YbaB
MYESCAERVARAYRELVNVRAIAESPNGFIAATAGPLGDLRELRIDPRVYRDQDAHALAEDVLETIEAAADGATRSAFDAAEVLLAGQTEPVNAELVLGPVLHELDRLIARTAHNGGVVPPGSRPTIDAGIDYEAHRRELEALRAEMLYVRGTADSDDGLITATTDACGKVFGLVLHQRIYRTPDARRLAEQITGTVRRATDEARCRMRTASGAYSDGHRGRRT